MIFFYVGPPKEDIFSGHLLSPIFQSSFYMLQLYCLALEAAQVLCMFHVFLNPHVGPFMLPLSLPFNQNWIER